MAIFNIARIGVVALAVTLTGCHVTSDQEDAYAACGWINNPNTRDVCMSNHVNTALAGRNAQWSAIGMGMLARPAATSCMNIGGIVTCR